MINPISIVNGNIRFIVYECSLKNSEINIFKVCAIER